MGLTKRNFAALITPSQPKLFGETGKITQSLFDIAVEEKQDLNAMRKELRMFSDMLAASEDFSDYLADENKGTEEKKKALATLLDDKDLKVTRFTRDFLVMLCDINKIGISDEIADGFDALYSYTKKETDAQVTTAQKLSDAQRKKLSKQVAGMLPAGYKINLVEKIDPAILGGLQLTVAGNAVDLSVSRAISFYEDKLSNASSA